MSNKWVYKERFSFYNCFQLSFCIWVLYDLLSLSENNNDWQGYADAYYQISAPEGDIGYYGLNTVFLNLGYSYGDFYTFFQCLTNILILWGCFRLNKSGLFVLLIVLLLLISPNLPILIRYYFAIGVLLNSLYYYVIRKKHIFYILYILAFAFHSGVILFVPVFLLDRYYTPSKELKVIKYFFIISLIIGVIKFVLIFLLSKVGLNVFGLYADQGGQWLSSLYFDVMYFIWFGYSYYLHNKVSKVRCDVLKKDRLYRILYMFLHFPILFLCVSDIQIVGIRIFEPILILCVVFVFYSQRYLKAKMSPMFACSLLVILSSLMKYYLLGAITGFSQWSYYYTDILLSNSRSVILKIFEL